MYPYPVSVLVTTVSEIDSNAHKWTMTQAMVPEIAGMDQAAHSRNPIISTGLCFEDLFRLSVMMLDSVTIILLTNRSHANHMPCSKEYGKGLLRFTSNKATPGKRKYSEARYWPKYQVQEFSRPWYVKSGYRLIRILDRCLLEVSNEVMTKNGNIRHTGSLCTKRTRIDFPVCDKTYKNVCWTGRIDWSVCLCCLLQNLCY